MLRAERFALVAGSVLTAISCAPATGANGGAVPPVGPTRRLRRIVRSPVSRAKPESSNRGCMPRSRQRSARRS